MSREHKAHAAAVTSSNCREMIGTSWKWIRAFAARHDVPVWTIGGRRVVPAAALLAAMQRVDAERPGLSFAAELAAMERELAHTLRKRTR